LIQQKQPAGCDVLVICDWSAIASIQIIPGCCTRFGVSQKFRISVIFRKNIMLVLKRRKGQEIIINGHIRIVVVQANDGSCSLAFDAPDSYRIRRGELPSFDEAVFHESTQTLQVQS